MLSEKKMRNLTYIYIYICTIAQNKPNPIANARGLKVRITQSTK